MRLRSAAAALLTAVGLALTTAACDMGYDPGPTRVPQPETLITANDTGGLDIVPGDNNPERVGAFPRDAGVADARAGEQRQWGDAPEPTATNGEVPHSHYSYLVVRLAPSGQETVFGLGYGALWVYSDGAPPQSLSDHIVLAEIAPKQRIVLTRAPNRTSSHANTARDVSIAPADATPAAYVGRWTVTLTEPTTATGTGTGTGTSTSSSGGSGSSGGDPPRMVSFGIDAVQAGQVAGESAEAVKGGSCVMALTLEPWNGDPLHRERVVLRAENVSGPDGRCELRYWMQLQVDAGKTVVKVSETAGDFSPAAVTAVGTAAKTP